MNVETGYCRLCGCRCPLSQEHVIPRSAGNKGRTYVHTLESVRRGLSRGEYFQNGFTRKSLCRACNSFCGREYVPAFARWTSQAAEYHGRLPVGSLVLLPFSLRPLFVAKLIAAMTASMALERSLDLPHYQALRRFVLSPQAIGLPGDFRFYTYLCFGQPVLEGFHFLLNTDGGPSTAVYAHVGMCPLGYVVLDDNPGGREWANNLNLCDITNFAFRRPQEIRTEYLHLPCVQGELPIRPMPRRRASDTPAATEAD